MTEPTTDITEITIRTRHPGKWAFVDDETGEVWRWDNDAKRWRLQRGYLKSREAAMKACPECGGGLQADWFVAFIGPVFRPVEFHVAFCNSCDWVTVIDFCNWRDSDEEETN